MELTTWLKEAAKEISYQECVYLAKSVLEIEFINEETLTPIAQKCLNYTLNQRKQGIPLSKIIGKKYFMESAFITTKDTLDPRPETEFLIENISIKPRTILDLGTGTGCIALSLLKKFPKAKALAIDISADALQVAKKNAMRLNLEKRIEFLQNNWANGIKNKFDLIISNPPYINPNAKLDDAKYDPQLALIGDHKTYEEVWLSAKNIQFKEFIFEVPQDLLEKVQSIFKQENIEIKKVYNTQIYMLKIKRQLGERKNPSPSF